METETAMAIDADDEEEEGSMDERNKNEMGL